MHISKHNKHRIAITLGIALATAFALCEESLRVHGLWGLAHAAGLVTNLLWIWGEA
jgi:hypothetical protein